MQSPMVLCLATNGYQSRWAFCIESHRQYCRAHGYEYAMMTDCAADLNGKWSKLHYAHCAVEQGHDLLLLDADTEATRNVPPFHLQLAQSEKDILVAHGLSGRPNSGVMMFRAGENSVAVEFLQRCLDLRGMRVPDPDFVTAEGENGHIIFLLKQEPFRSRTGLLDRKWNCTDPAFAENALILHYTYLLRRHLGHLCATRCFQREWT
jgi:hypothetical protein